MSLKTPFVNKLLKHIDRLDKEAITNCVVELAQDAQNYREVLDLLPVGVVLLTKDGRLVYVNDQFLNYLGLARGELNPKKMFSEFVLDPELKRLVKQEISNGSLQKDMRVYHPREMDLRCRIMKLSDSEREKTMVLLWDISAEKTRDIEKQRIERNEAFLRLAAGVAHEIGNPLNSINIHLNLIQKALQKLPESSRTSLVHTVSIIQSETLRLDQIIRNFLKATRRPPLRFKLEDLNEIASEAGRFFAPELKQKKITLHFKKDTELPSFMMDRERIYEVFINLIKNAVEAMPNGGDIKVSTSHKNKVCMIVISDRGGGIHEKDLAHIFEAYYTTKKEGSGLGLMLVYDAVSEHGGRIDVETKLGQGTKFTILLPIRRPKQQLTSR